MRENSLTVFFLIAAVTTVLAVDGNISPTHRANK